jgi:hypothetical protein
MGAEVRADSSLRWGFIAAVTAVAAQGSAHLAAGLLSGTAHVGLLDSASNNGLVAAATVSAGAAAAVAAATAGLRHRERRDRARIVALALLLCFLAVDRVTSLHDRLGYAFADVIHLPHVDAWPTPLVYAPLLAPAAWILWRGTAFPATRKTARAGVALFALSLAMRPLALGVVLASGRSPHGTAREVVVAIQEGLALGGWMFVAAALLAGARLGASRSPWSWVRSTSSTP